MAVALAAAPKPGVEATYKTITESQLIKWIEAGQPLAVQDVLVTRALAKVMLQYNEPGVTNRLVIEGYVKQVAHSLQKKLWTNTGELIIFSDQKTLNDGQHRLFAVVESNVPMIVDLRFGVPRAGFEHTNIGRSRKVSDVLAMRGMSHRHNIAAAVRLILLYQRGLPKALGSRTVPGTAEVLEALERWPDLIEMTSLVRQQSAARVLSSAPVLALAFFANRTAERKVFNAFFDVVFTGEGLREVPAHQFREAYILGGLGSTRDKRIVGFALGILAWNAHRNPDFNGRKLKWTKTMPFPVVDGLKL